MPVHPDHNGFTLIEALVVLAVVGLVTALAYPELQRSIDSFRARQARGVVVAGLQAARTAAMRTGRPVPLVVAPGGTSFAINGATPVDLPENAKITDSPAPLWFYPDGSVNGGRLVLSTSVSATRYEVSRDLGNVTEQPAETAAQSPTVDRALFDPATILRPITDG